MRPPSPWRLALLDEERQLTKELPCAPPSERLLATRRTHAHIDRTAENHRGCRPVPPDAGSPRRPAPRAGRSARARRATGPRRAARRAECVASPALARPLPWAAAPPHRLASRRQELARRAARPACGGHRQRERFRRAGSARRQISAFQGRANGLEGLTGPWHRRDHHGRTRRRWRVQRGRWRRRQRARAGYSRRCLRRIGGMVRDRGRAGAEGAEGVGGVKEAGGTVCVDGVDARSAATGGTVLVRGGGAGSRAMGGVLLRGAAAGSRAWRRRLGVRRRLRLGHKRRRRLGARRIRESRWIRLSAWRSRGLEAQSGTRRQRRQRLEPRRGRRLRRNRRRRLGPRRSGRIERGWRRRLSSWRRGLERDRRHALVARRGGRLEGDRGYRLGARGRRIDHRLGPRLGARGRRIDHRLGPRLGARGRRIDHRLGPRLGAQRCRIDHCLRPRSWCVVVRRAPAARSRSAGLLSPVSCRAPAGALPMAPAHSQSGSAPHRH